MASAVIVQPEVTGMVKLACEVVEEAGVVVVTAAAAVVVRAVRRRGEATRRHTCVHQCASSSPANRDS